MPAAISPERPQNLITKLTNCRLVKGNTLVEEDLWISSQTGKILPAQEIFYEHQLGPDQIIDLQGRIVSPGFIDSQFNGAYGFDFSTPGDVVSYQKGIKALNQKLVQTGLTSYLPTIITQKPEVYHKALPYLGPSGQDRIPEDGAESLGAHCEGPFMSAHKKGVHNESALREATSGFASIEQCYGAANLTADTIKMITAAPEVEGVMESIPELTSRGIIMSIGHTDADFEKATEAINNGATMITHLFNAMKPLHHRNPGIFGLLGQNYGARRPYFGLIADGIHLHPTTVKIAWAAHPEGMVLVTDALALMGMDDGVYEWTNGDMIVKKGSNLTKQGTETLAGGCASLLQCLNNFLTWTGAPIPTGLAAVTSTPAKMLGMYPQKGTLETEADADLCVLSEVDVIDENGFTNRVLQVDEVWKFGKRVFERT
ncbi:hypothetical protein AAFC00_006055 [Neodothiora populina]|uniref:N-acetylglucosamine-6-phosphate deacetylase n=1 Tax=Neodothiora populina TaxID=2781224 RepID=A0ABR3P6S7_9PEZI